MAVNPKILSLTAALGSGGLLAVMAHLNGVLTIHGGAVLASWIAHGTGTITALVFMLGFAAFGRKEQLKVTSQAPAWAYLGGVSGAATVILISLAVNSPIALSGTIALTLVGQGLFSLAADWWGLFGLSARRVTLRDVAAMTLIIAGSCLMVFYGK
ncbi:DMT family transporter [Agrobacterium vitis]|nr:DMT family transporter [Agrobacterium vitis]